LDDAAFTYQIDTYARMYGLNRQQIINDDLGALDELPRIIARGAAMKVESVFWTLVLASFGSTFFSNANGNHTSGAPSALSETALGDAVELMRKMVDDDGEPIMVQLETTADKLFASTNVVVAGVTDTNIPSANVFLGKYRPTTVPYLSNTNYTGYSLTAWYLFGDPNDVAAFGLAYLNGVEAPTVEQSDADFHTLGIQWRGYLDFGVCTIDKQGAVMSAGK
jgi:hypothetical protein